MTEKQLITQLNAFCRKNKIIKIKLSDPNFTGLPDYLLIQPHGEHIYVELKGDGGRLSERQEYVHKQLRGRGCKVFVLWGSLEVLEKMLT